MKVIDSTTGYYTYQVFNYSFSVWQNKTIYTYVKTTRFSNDSDFSVFVKYTVYHRGNHKHETS